MLLHEWDYDRREKPRTQQDELGRIRYDRQEPYTNLITWVYDGGSYTPVAKLTEEGCYTIVQDYLGTPIQTLGSKGEVIWDCILDIYGDVLELRGERNFIPFRFQGQYEDGKTGLYYNSISEGVVDPIRVTYVIITKNIMNNTEKLQKAIAQDEIFDFLVGKGEYEIKLYEANMPTDTITVSRTIKSYIQLNPYFDKSEFYEAFYELSKSEWSWLIVYYMQDSELDFISFTNLLPNLREQKKSLSTRNEWICFNFGDDCPNLWSVVMYELNAMNGKGIKLPDLSDW